MITGHQHLNYIYFLYKHPILKILKLSFNIIVDLISFVLSNWLGIPTVLLEIINCKFKEDFA